MIGHAPALAARAGRARTDVAPLTRLLNVTVALYVASSMLFFNIPGLSRAPHLLILITFALLVVRSKVEPVKLRLDAVVPLIAVFGFYGVASVLWSTNQGEAFISAVSLAFDLFGAVVVWAALQNGVSLRLVAITSAGAAVLQGCIGLYQNATLGSERAVGLTGNANSLAIQLSMAAFLLLLVIPRNRWASLLALALVIVATVTTGTRKLIFVWFAYFIALARDLLPALRKPSLGSAVALLLAPLAVWASFNYGPMLITPVVSDLTFIDRLEMTLRGGETAKRSALIYDGLDVWWRQPVFGHGIDQYRYTGRFTTYSHNNYVELLADFGVVGLVLYYLIFLVLGWRAVRGLLAGHQSAWVVLAILVVYLLMDFARVSYSSRMTWLYLLVLALVTSGYGRRATAADDALA